MSVATRRNRSVQNVQDVHMPTISVTHALCQVDKVLSREWLQLIDDFPEWTIPKVVPNTLVLPFLLHNVCTPPEFLT